jgi:tripartite-type tricarboxylate transporter receptor subunit TctC
MYMNRRLFGLGVGAGLFGLYFSTESTAANWPTRPIRWVVPYAPGGLSDTSTRIVVQKIIELTGWTIVIENKPGANGLIGSEYVARAAPDGYTFLNVLAAHAVNPTLYAGTLNFDPLKSLTPVSLVGITPLIISISKALPVKDLKEFIAYGKANPGKLSFGSSGVGAAAHMATEQFKIATGIDMVHVPYKGSGPALQDLMGNNIQVLIDTPPTLLPQVRSNNIKALAIMSSHRLASAPDLPTLLEAGGPDLDCATWSMFLTTTGVSKEIMNRMAYETKRAVSSPDIQARFEQLGLEPVGSTPEEASKFLKAEVAKMAVIIQSKNIKPE